MATLEVFKERRWRPGDIGGQATSEAYPSRGVRENIRTKGTSVGIRRVVFVKHVVREMRVARLTSNVGASNVFSEKTSNVRTSNV